MTKKNNEKLLDGFTVPTETITWNGVEITVRRTIGLKDAIAMVDDIVDMSFLEDGTYVPHMTDFATRINALSRYTDFSLPEDIEQQYELVYSTSLYEEMTYHINMKQLGELVLAAERKIDMLCDADVLAVRHGIEKLLSTLEGLAQKMENTFNGVSGEEVANLAGAVKKDTVDEAKIVEALLKAQRKPKTKAKKKA